jgi:hypothetical protein
MQRINRSIVAGIENRFMRLWDKQNAPKEGHQKERKITRDRGQTTAITSTTRDSYSFFAFVTFVNVLPPEICKGRRERLSTSTHIFDRVK